jgi:hypothetical protein
LNTCLRCRVLSASLSWLLVYGEMVCRAIALSDSSPTTKS